MHELKKCIFLFFIFIAIENAFAQTDLNTSKRELNKEKKEKNQQQEYNAPKSSYGSSNSFGDQLAGSIIGNLFAYVVVGMVGNYSNESHLNNRLSKYPYRNALNGNYTRQKSENIHSGIRLDIEDHFLFSNKELYGNHLKAKFRPFHYFYFQSEMFQLYEYNNTLDKHDNLLLYNLDFCYDRLRYERFNFGFTMGANYIANDVKKGGFAFGFNTEIFISKPISVYGSVKWSGINNNPVNTFELQGKYHIKNFYISAGYQHMRIASPKYRFASFGLGIYL